MKPEDFKEYLLDVLDDILVKDKVISILDSNYKNKYDNYIKDEELINKYNKLAIENKELLDSIHQLEEKISELNIERESLKQFNIDSKSKISSIIEENKVIREENIRISDENKNLNRKIDELESYFREEKEIYSTYKNLPEENKKILKGIYKGDTFESFLYCGVQYSNIEALWEYVKTLIVNGNLENIEELRKIFKFFLKSHNKIYDTDIYMLQEVSLGDTFDEDSHMRGFNSKISGKINEIYLQGYINLNTRKIVKKTIVKV